MEGDLNRTCRTANRSLIRLESALSTAEAPTIAEIESYKLLLADVKATFEQAQTQLEQKASSNEELENAWKQRDKFEDTILKINTWILNMTMVNDTNTSMLNSSNASVRLPKINLPKFSGDILKWLEFKDMFTHAVGDSNLSNVSKLQYLKSALEGEAADLIQSLQLTDLNFEVAWSLLMSKYDNKRLNAFQLFQKLFLLPSIEYDTITQLKKMLNGLVECKEMLRTLNLNTFDNFLFFLIYTKLDTKTRNDFEMTLKNNNIPQLEVLVQHLTRLTVASEMTLLQPQPNKSSRTYRNPTQRSYFTTSNKSCLVCGDRHPIYLCPVFRDKSPQDRMKTIKAKSLCIMCLKCNHALSECKGNPRYLCRCGQSHHHLLHFPSGNSTDNSSDTASSSNVREVPATLDNTDTATIQRTFSCTKTENKKFIALPTAVVKFKCRNIVGKLRVLLDSCSQVTIIRDSAIKKFSLPSKESSVISSVKGFGGNKITANKTVHLQLHSVVNQFSLKIAADVVPANSFEYTSNLDINSDLFAKLKGFKLADPNFHKINDVDIILGAEYFEQVVLSNVSRIEHLFLRETQFGWTISGPMVENIKGNKFCGFTTQTLERQLEQFWVLEDVPASSSAISTAEDVNEATKCMEFFRKNLSTASDGKFIVKLPFRDDPETIDSNRGNAMAALYRIESKLEPQLKAAYDEFLVQYENLGHMSKVQPTKQPHYFLPHHAVLKESATTPLRVVFNASSSKRGEYSLNELLLTGPSIQAELFDLLLINRRYPFVFAADIEKMYRMIWVAPEHRRFQRILWRSSPHDRIAEYELNTITYGTVPASYLATACLEIIAETIRSSHPVAAAAILNNFYMDDFICGAHTVSELIELQAVVHRSLESYGFKLRKYIANEPSILRNVDNNLISEARTELHIHDDTPNSSILGLIWDYINDCYKIKIRVPVLDERNKLSRRIILSIISRTFDPLGFLSPVTIRGKLILQKLWIPGQSWDDPVPQELKMEFMSYIKQLSALSRFQIDRYLNFSQFSELIGFCDASSVAYCAVIYLKTSDSNNEFATCKLVCSKTKLAPLKKLSIPRLELQAAVLLASLIDRVSSKLQISTERIFAFTDSSTVLCWLSKTPSEWKAFVHNRVAKISASVPFSRWNYIPTTLNPADLATRGITANEFLSKKTWLHGPDFIRTSLRYSAFPVPCIDLQVALEKRKIDCVTMTIFKTVNILEYFSSYVKMIRAMAYLIRFVSFRYFKTAIQRSPIDNAEFQSALLVVLRLHQSQYFSTDTYRLRSEQGLKSKSVLCTLHPFLDSSSLLRVGGRLDNSMLSYDRKHPIIIYGKSNFVKTLCRFFHEHYFHSNMAFIANMISQKYWIIGGRNRIIKAVLRNCIVCQKYKATVGTQLMGQLPASRVIPSRPFSETGVDFAGPFTAKCTNHRNTKFTKVYLAIFVCMKTRATHLEVVSALTTDAFIATLQRFVSRRGRPLSIFSDNGTNFIGTANVINANKLLEFGAKENINWKFIPPRAPHHGGIWEAAVKSAKTFLVKTIQNHVLNYEEYHTLFTRIEAVMNSRPLCYRSSSDQGSEIITPGHFLVGSSLMENAFIENESIAITRRLELIHNLVNGFWKIWHRDYLHQLQQRYKWQNKSPNVVVGSMVLVREPGSAVFQWPLGKIITVYPDSQGLVRVVDVQFGGKVKRRSIVTIVPLQLDA